MKKSIVKAIAVILMIIVGIEANTKEIQAANMDTQTTKMNSEKDLKSSSYDNLEVLDMDYSKKLKKGCVVVDAKVVCDSTYRKKFSKDWSSRSKKTVVQATNFLYDKFNIYYKVKKGVTWDSGKTKDPEELLSQLYSKYNVNKNKNVDVVIGFTRKRQGNVLGIGYIGYPYALVCSTVYKTDIQTAQHETGHNYKLRHCNNKKCTMYPYSYQENVNRLCEKHQKQWKTNRKLY